MSSQEPIRTAVVGLGLGGLTFHIPFVLSSDKFTLHSVLERNPSSEGGKVQARYGVSPKIYRTLESLLEDPEIELVIITSPNDTHYPFAKAALEAGKHVLVDKPVCATSAQAKELGKIASSKRLVLYAFQNRRYDSDFLALKQLLDLPESSSHSLGKVVDFESHFDRYSTAKKGTWKDKAELPASGWVYDLGAHLIDQALTLFGRPEKLTAIVQHVRGFDVDDNFMILLHYPPGSALPYPFTAILRAHILSVKAIQPRFIVRGTKGTFTKSGVDIQEDQLKAISSYTDIENPDYGKEPEVIWGTLETLQEDGSVKTSVWPSQEPGNYKDLFLNLASAIRDGTELAIKWEEATSVIEMVELAHKSSKEGTTVQVPKV